MTMLERSLPLLSRSRKDRTLKIVLVGPVYPFRGGIAHYTARLAQELASQHQVSVLSFQRQFPRWLYPGQSDRDPSQRGLAVQAEYLLEPLNPLSWWRSASRIRAENLTWCSSNGGNLQSPAHMVVPACAGAERSVAY
jgi:hypothetical protein